MGVIFSRIGSDPYYASYERSFERISKELSRLEQILAVRGEQQRNLKTKFLTWGVPLIIITFAWAAWVRQQPPGTYTSQEHFVRVLPVFLVPSTEWMLYVALRWVLHWVEARDRARKDSLQAKLKKMAHELKDSTRYQRTNSLLQKYDPDFQPPTPAPVLVTPGPRGRLRHLQSAPNSPSTPVMQGLRAGPLGSPMAPSTMRGRSGNSWLSALDHLANVTVGSDPVLAGAVREAKQQAEKLREQLQAAEAYAHRLRRENAELRARLGDEQPPSDQPAPAQSTSANSGSGAEGHVQAPGSAASDASDQQQLPEQLRRNEQHQNRHLTQSDANASAEEPDQHRAATPSNQHTIHEAVDDAFEMVPKALTLEPQSHQDQGSREPLRSLPNQNPES